MTTSSPFTEGTKNHGVAWRDAGTEDRLDALGPVPDPQGHSLRSLEDALATVDPKRFLRSVLDHGIRAVLLARSQRHSNGFTKLVLAHSWKSGASLTLHAWFPTAISNADNIHNHRWPFASRILSGTLRFRVFTEDTGGVSRAAYRYTPNGTDGYWLESLGRKRIAEVSSETFVAGDAYTLDPFTLHRASSEGDHPTVTLVLQGGICRESTTILPLGTVSRDSVTRRFDTMTGREAIEVLEHVLTY